MFLQAAPINLEHFERHDFWQHVDTPNTDDCWLWLQSTASHGYGQTWDGITVRLAHRVAWVLWHREQVPEDMTIDHTCRNRICVNPAHLRLLTNVDNARLNGHAVKTHCVRGHELVNDNVRINRSGHRYCRACQHIRNVARAA